MKKLKIRIKRALAAFLKDELLDYIGYNHKIPQMSLGDRFHIDSHEFETVVMEEIIDIDSGRNPNFLHGDPMQMEEHIEKCKQKFAAEVVKNIYVDAQNLTSREHFMQRSVRFILRVQKPKHY